MSAATPRQLELLRRLAKGDRYLRGADVRVAQALEAKGFASVTDYGSLKLHGKSDGERWLASITATGSVLANRG